MIVDASVAAKWTLDHPDTHLAEALLNRTDLAAPSNILIEVAHALTREVRRRNLTPQRAREALLVLSTDTLRFVDFNLVFSEAIDLSLRLHATIHDCLYLAVAEREDDVLVTADQRFARAVAQQANLRNRVRLLGDIA